MKYLQLKRADRNAYKFFSCKVTERFAAVVVAILLGLVIIAQLVMFFKVAMRG